MRNVETQISRLPQTRFLTSLDPVLLNVTRLAAGYNHGYTHIMKTAISIPDEVFEAADRAAKKLGVSRSEFYSTAVYEFIERNRMEDVTSKLNEVYASSASNLDENLAAMQHQLLAKDDW